MLPGMLYEGDKNRYTQFQNDPLEAQAFQLLMNYDQLYNHIVLLEKSNPLIKSLEQLTLELTSRYTNLHDNPSDSNATQLIT
jgi:hypothetical protein